MQRLRGSVTSTLPLIKVLIPTTAIEPNTNIIMPPITMVGIVERECAHFTTEGNCNCPYRSPGHNVWIEVASEHNSTVTSA